MCYFFSIDIVRSKTIYRRRLRPWAARHPADLSRKVARQPKRLDGRVDLPLKLGIQRKVLCSWSVLHPIYVETS